MKSLNQLRELRSRNVNIYTHRKIIQVMYSTYDPEFETIKVRYENTDIFITVEMSEIIEEKSNSFKH